MNVTDPTAFLHESMPLTSALGITAETLTAELVELSLDWSGSLCTANDILHGGALMTLADSAGAVIAFLNLPDGAVGTSTIESKTNFMGGVADGTVVAAARPLHVGSTTIVVEAELTHGGRLVAKTIQTQAVLRQRDPAGNR